MTKEDIMRKLSSRKLWAAVGAAAIALFTGLTVDALPPELLSVVKTGIYGLISYIFGESAVDLARVLK